MDKIRIKCKFEHYSYLYKKLCNEKDISEDENVAIAQIRLRVLIKNSILCFEESKNEIELLKQNNPSLAIIYNTTIKTNSNEEEYKSNEKEIKYFHLILNDVVDKTKNEFVSKETGILHLNYQDIYNKADIYFVDEEIEVSPNNTNEFLGWGNIVELKTFYNSSAVVCDNYFLKNVLWTVDIEKKKIKSKSSIYKNLIEMIESITSSDNENKTISFIQHISEAEKKKNENPSNEHQNQLIYLNQNLSEKIKKVNFGIYNLISNETENDKLHDRDIYTNYLTINIGTSFDIYSSKVEIQENKTTKIRIRSVFNPCKGKEMANSTLIFNKTQLKLKHLKSAISKLKLENNDFSETPTMPTKHNYLFDFYGV